MEDLNVELEFEDAILALAILKAYSEDEFNRAIHELHEWSRTHLVLSNPRLIEFYGTDELDYNNMPPHEALPPQPILKESPIYHICCCGKISTHPILTTVHRCGCGAVWSGTNGSTLQVFGSTSCYDCYAHETKGLRNPKSYILDHCKHARRKMRKY